MGAAKAYNLEVGAFDEAWEIRCPFQISSPMYDPGQVQVHSQAVFCVPGSPCFGNNLHEHKQPHTPEPYKIVTKSETPFLW